MAKGPGGFSVGRVSIQVVPDTSKFRQQLLRELKKETKGIKVEIPVDLNAAKAVAQLKALDAILKRIDGRNVNIGASVNAKGDFEKIARDLSKVGKSASEAASGFGHMSRMALIALAVVLLLAPALALIATLLAGLPSLLLAFGAAALAVGLGIDGIKKAASGFAPTIERLKASLSKTFADQLTKPFIELNKIAPVLDKGLNKIAVSLSGIVAQMIKFVTSGQGMAQLDTILNNTAKFFAELTPAITDGFRAFMLLASEASQEFGGLAATMRRFASGFLDVVKRVSEDGTLGSALRNLNVVLDSLLEAFNRFFEAGLRAMTVLGGPIANLFDGFTDLIVALMPVLTAVSKLVFDVFGEAFRQLAPIVEALTPAIQTLGQLLGQLLTGALKVLGPLLVQIATILNNVFLRVFTALAPFIPQIIQFFTQLAQILGEFLLQAFIALSPLLTVFLQFITDLFTALTPLMPMLLELATVALRTLTDILVELAPELVFVAQQLFPQLLQIVKDLVPVFKDVVAIIIEILPYLADLASFLMDLVIPAMTAILQIVAEVWPRIREIINSALLFIKGIVNVIMGLITLDIDRAWQGIKQIFEGALGVLKNAAILGLQLVLEAFIALPSKIVNALLGLPASLFSSGKAMMQGLIDGIKSMAQTVINSVLSVVEQARDLLPFSPAKKGPFSGSGYTTYSGRALMEDWAKGITEGSPEAVRAIEGAMQASQTALDMQAVIASDGYGSMADKIAEALSQWGVEIDANGVARMVNKINNMNARR